MDLLYSDEDILVCCKPPYVLSTDEPGGMPELLRQSLGNETAQVFTVHRLDRAASGIMIFARSHAAASELSRQIRDREFEKEYLAVVHGIPPEREGVLRDLLARNKARKMTFVVTEAAKGVQEAALDYRILSSADGLSMIHVRLHTGRTHQIRVQFASRGWPLVGERKYAELTDDGPLALWSYRIAFAHPKSGNRVSFSALPPQTYPWMAAHSFPKQPHENRTQSNEKA